LRVFYCFIVTTRLVMLAHPTNIVSRGEGPRDAEASSSTRDV